MSVTRQWPQWTAQQAGTPSAGDPGEEQAQTGAPASETVRKEEDEDLRCYVCGARCYIGVIGFRVEVASRTLWVCNGCLAETPAQRFERLEALRHERDESSKLAEVLKVSLEAACRDRDKAFRERDDAINAMAASRLAEERALRKARETAEECRERAEERDAAIAERDQARATFALSDASEVAARLAETEEDLRKMTGARDYFRANFRDTRAACESLRLELATACAERDAALSARGEAIIEAQQARQERREARFREIAARAARLGGGPA